MKEPILTAISKCKRSSSSILSPELVEGAFAMLGFMDHQELLDTFIHRTHNHWPLIATAKDASPIIDSVLGGFEELGKERIAEIQRVVKDKEVDEEVQNQLLTLGKSLVRIAIRHLHTTSGSAHSSCTGAAAPLPSIDVKAMAKLYDLDLTARK